MEMEGMQEETRAQMVRPTSELDQAIERLNKAESQLATCISSLHDRLTPILRPDVNAVPKEGGLDAVKSQPSQVVERLWSHADGLENHAQRLVELIGRLDV